MVSPVPFVTLFATVPTRLLSTMLENCGGYVFDTVIIDPAAFVPSARNGTPDAPATASSASFCATFTRHQYPFVTCSIRKCANDVAGTACAVMFDAVLESWNPVNTFAT